MEKEEIYVYTGNSLLNEDSGSEANIGDKFVNITKRQVRIKKKKQYLDLVDGQVVSFIDRNGVGHVFVLKEMKP